MQLYQDTIQDRNGNVISSAVVTITDYPGGATSTVYAADVVGANINPITADSDGQYEFYAVPGAYTLTVTKSGVTTESKVVTLGAAATSFLQSGTGAVSRSVQAKERDIFSKADFGSLAQAITAASAGVVLEPATGQLWLLGGVNPTFDEASDVVARCLGFDTGATLTIPASKQFDAIAWGDTGSNQVFSIGSAGIGALMRFNLESAAASHATSNLYGVIGAITNLGPGITKPINVRAIAGSGCTGVVIGAVIGANSRTGSTAYGIQMTFDTDTSGTITAGIWQTSNSGTTANLDYGLLLDDIAIQPGGAGFQMRAKSTGDFLRLNNSAGSANLWKVDSTGKQTIGTASNGLEFTASMIARNVASGNLAIHAGSGGTLYLGANAVYPMSMTGTVVTIDQATARLNFGGAGSTTIGANGAASALTANPLGYLICQVNGADVKVPYYNT